jgi:hypothetical protein
VRGKRGGGGGGGEEAVKSRREFIQSKAVHEVDADSNCTTPRRSRDPPINNCPTFYDPTSLHSHHAVRQHRRRCGAC